MLFRSFKSGSSSLKVTARQINYFELRELRTVEVFLRDPFERYVSGVQTYLRHLPPELDRSTVLAMIGEFIFLNRHFALQFHWVMNLARHTDAWMYFRPMSELSTATEYTWNALARDQTLVEYFQNHNKLHFYLTLDKVLYEEFMGMTVPLVQIVNHIKNKHDHIYREIIQRSQELCSVLG